VQLYVARKAHPSALPHNFDLPDGLCAVYSIENRTRIGRFNPTVSRYKMNYYRLDNNINVLFVFWSTYQLHKVAI
jgi:hypothetical protein